MYDLLKTEICHDTDGYHAAYNFKYIFSNENVWN